ncbi:MAG: hypothetical protein SO157_07075 [Bullifex sp.]|nr:hypothetical protein [Bullifex sp.]
MKLSDIAGEIYTGVLTRRVVFEEGELAAMSEAETVTLESARILMPKAIAYGVIDPNQLQEVKLKKEVKEKFRTHLGDVIMKLSSPYDCCVIEKEEDENLIVPSFCLRIGSIDEAYDPYFIMAFLTSASAWKQIEKTMMGRALSIISNESVSELMLPDMTPEQRHEAGYRYERTLEFRRTAGRIIRLEKERNDSLFLSMEVNDEAKL